MGRRAPLFAAAAVLLVQCTSVSPTSATTPSAAAACAWPIQGSLATVNADLIDAAASYWAQIFKVQSNLRIVMKGRYPDARYASVQVYTGIGASFTANGAGTGLTDYQIAPDSGSINPWRQPGSPGGRFTITLRTDASPGQMNTMPLAPTGTADGAMGLIEYRVYLPAGGDFSKVVPPTLMLQTPGTTVTLSPCQHRTQPSGVNPSTTPSTSRPQSSPSAPARVVQPLQFYRDTTNALTPNADSGYLVAYLTPPTGDRVVVISAKAARALQGDHPTPWPAPNIDMRYWSMCSYLLPGGLPLVVNKLADGTTDNGCRSDEQTKVNASGDYTYVIGTESQRAAIEAIPDVTFIPFSAAQPSALHLLLLRNMLVNGAFGFAVQRVPSSRDPSSAAAVLGPYYPHAAICALNTVMTSGPAACLSAK